jgi:hypothetical protein
MMKFLSTLALRFGIVALAFVAFATYRPVVLSDAGEGKALPAGAPAAVVAAQREAGMVCWSGVKPAHVIGDPTVVVYSVNLSGAKIGKGEKVYAAIEQAVFGVDHGIRVHAFCA